jgi:hypothetical protein
MPFSSFTRKIVKSITVGQPMNNSQGDQREGLICFRARTFRQSGCERMRIRFVLCILPLLPFSPGCGLVGTALHNLYVEMRDTAEEHKEEKHNRKLEKLTCSNDRQGVPERTDASEYAQGFTGGLGTELGANDRPDGATGSRDGPAEARRSGNSPATAMSASSYRPISDPQHPDPARDPTPLLPEGLLRALPSQAPPEPIRDR